MHKTVLLEEAVDYLNIKKGSIVIDATLGRGGHAEKIMESVGEKGRIVAIDIDQEAIEQFKDKLRENESKPEVHLIHKNFSELTKILEELGIEKVDAILADLGWRSEQIDSNKYGLSFLQDGPLDMRLGGDSQAMTAADIVNERSKEELAEIFKKYGEERHAAKVAEAIVNKRGQGKITRTGELAELIEETIGKYYRDQKIHPATRVFQALRIAVNDEMKKLEIFLKQALNSLEPGGRLAVISFHSLEDRIVKNFFRTNAGGCICPKELPVCVCEQKKEVEVITRKPVTPNKEEIKSNPRSRSAKLRVAEKK